MTRFEHTSGACDSDEIRSSTGATVSCNCFTETTSKNTIYCRDELKSNKTACKYYLIAMCELYHVRTDGRTSSI